MNRRDVQSTFAMLAVAGLAASAQAWPDFPEVEPNETKAQALTNGPFVLGAGDSVSGGTTGSSTITAGAASADTFLIKTTPQALGIYRHRLVITTAGTAGHTGTIRGTNQTAAAAGVWPGPVGTAGTTDSAAQTSSTTTTPARFVQWYGFGKEEQINFRVTGTASTAANYAATLETQAVAPIVVAGGLEAGNITVSTIGATTVDTDFWVYDSNLNAIAGSGCDDESANGGGTGATSQGILTRNYAPGTYYLAISNFNLANNQGSPCDDDFRTGTMLDYPDAVTNSSTTANMNVSFKLTDANGTVTTAATKAAAFDVVWVQFTVGTGLSGACCLADGTCQITSVTGCGTAGGIYRGDGTGCATANCPQPGACCLIDGSCSLLQESACTAQSGIWRGAGAPCATANCPQPCANVVATLGGAANWPVTHGIQTGRLFRDGIPDTCVLAAAGGAPLAGSFGYDKFDFVNNSGAVACVRVDFNTACTGTNFIYAGAYIGTYDPGNPTTNNIASIGGSPNPTAFMSFNVPPGTAFSVVVAEVTAGAGCPNYRMIVSGIPDCTPVASCYANCDDSSIPPILNVNDFQCFLNRYGAGDTWANCDNSTIAPILNVNDFTCFINAYAAGCP